MRRIGLTLFITLLLTALAIPGTAYAASTTIYMSPSGSDSASGTSGSPVKSLQGVKRVLINRGGDTATIMVRAGTYYETKMASWNGIPQDHLNFRRDGSNRPVFDGRNLTGTARYWMSTAGGPSLDVRELLVRNYRTGGIRFDTDGNTVRNMFFERIGNRHVSGGPGYAALHLLGSSKNTFNNIVFRNLENSDCPGCVHGVYAANNSDSNTISNSTFDRITGDPVRSATAPTTTPSPTTSSTETVAREPTGPRCRSGGSSRAKPAVPTTASPTTNTTVGITAAVTDRP